MSRRRRARHRRQPRGRPHRRRFRFTLVNCLVYIPFLIVMGVSLVSYLAVTLYRHPDVWHWSVTALILVLAVVILRARMRAM